MMTNRLAFLICFLIGILFPSYSRLLAQDTKAPTPSSILLWPAGAPLAQGSAPEDQPRLTVFIPTVQKTQTGVVICPGGGYGMLATDHEGKQVAQWLNNLGVAAFMLEYRLGPKYRHPVQMLDAQRAMRYVRSHASEYHLDPRRIGVWGFSAGGHLAAQTETHFDAGNPAAQDTVERASSRPDFAILSYPVIGPVGGGAKWSFQNILGNDPSPKQIEELSPDLHVTRETPTTFIVHSDDDDGVWPINSIRFYTALKAAGVPAELHIYRSGGHGYGLAPFDVVLSSYPLRVADCLRGLGLL